MSASIPEQFFQTQFVSQHKINHWPIHFAIISQSLDQQSAAESASEDLETYLLKHFTWVKPLTEINPAYQSGLPCYAVNAGWDQACTIGLSYQQTVIYYVSDNTLSVTFCDERRKPYVVDGFLQCFLVDEG